MMSDKVVSAKGIRSSKDVIAEYLVASLGLLDIRKGAGMFVRAPSGENLEFRGVDYSNLANAAKFLEIRAGLDAAAYLRQFWPWSSALFCLPWSRWFNLPQRMSQGSVILPSKVDGLRLLIRTAPSPKLVINTGGRRTPTVGILFRNVI